MSLVLIIISFILMSASTILALTLGQITPIDRNIIYIHVPASICSLLCFCALFIFSLLYLIKTKPIYDRIAAASAESAFIFATVLNITGMIFAKAQWGLWWTPSFRLISSAILWFLAVAYLLLRNSLDQHPQKNNLCSVFGIIAFIDVPFVYISARFIRDIHRPNFTFENPYQTTAFVSAIIATLLLTIALVRIRTTIQNINEKLNS